MPCCVYAPLLGRGHWGMASGGAQVWWVRADMSVPQWQHQPPPWLAPTPLRVLPGFTCSDPPDREVWGLLPTADLRILRRRGLQRAGVDRPLHPSRTCLHMAFNGPTCTPRFSGTLPRCSL